LTAGETFSSETLLLSRGDVADLLTLPECVAAVEDGFRRHARGASLTPAVLGVRAEGGGFHFKAAGLKLDRRVYFAAKTNANFPGNRARFGLPTIQGIVLLFDGDTGAPLAAMDSMQITTLRTGAATAVAAKRLARSDSRVATVCGCGVQGGVQLDALALALSLEKAWVFDADAGRAREFAAERSATSPFRVEPAANLAAAVRASDVVVTCTPSRRALISVSDVSPGTFLAAVGADSAEKQELDPQIFTRARIVVDSLDQCALIGDLHHAIAAGLVSRDDVHAGIEEVIEGTKPGRTSAEEITVFDSTGTALEDVAAAAAVYEKATAAGRGISFSFSSGEPATER
jgi:alanine dehydrogenase